jgi:fructose transport system substrate-binding protein
MVDSNGADKPQNSAGLDFVDAGVALVTDKPVQGLESITSADAEKICWGGK